MNPGRKNLPNFAAATATGLTRPTRIDLHHQNTGTFGLVSQRCQKASPGDIGNRSAQPAVPDHPLDVQALHLRSLRETT